MNEDEKVYRYAYQTDGGKTIYGRFTGSQRAKVNCPKLQDSFFGRITDAWVEEHLIDPVIHDKWKRNEKGKWKRVDDDG